MQAGSGALLGRFEAFKFSETTVVNFEVNVQFCQDACNPVRRNFSLNFLTPTSSAWDYLREREKVCATLALSVSHSRRGIKSLHLHFIFKPQLLQSLVRFVDAFYTLVKKQTFFLIRKLNSHFSKVQHQH